MTTEEVNELLRLGYETGKLLKKLRRLKSEDLRRPLLARIKANLDAAKKLGVKIDDSSLPDEKNPPAAT